MGAEHKLTGSDAFLNEDRLPTARRFRTRALLVAGIALLAVPAIAAAVGAISRQAEAVRKLESEIAGLDARYGQAAAAYNAASARLATVKKRISDNTAALKKAQAEFVAAQEILAFRVSAVYRQPQPSNLEVLLRSGSLTDAMSRVDTLDRVQRQDASIIKKIAAARETMRTARVALLADQKVAAAETKETANRLGEVRSIRAARHGVLISARQRLAVMITAEVNRQRRAALVAAQRRVVQRVGQDGANSGNAGSGGSAPVVAPPVAPPSSGGGDVSAALRKIAQCESGGNPSAVSPSGLYGGKYQFDPQTWQSLGGTGLPQNASEAEQDRIAAILYGQRGAAPWPICGR